MMKCFRSNHPLPIHFGRIRRNNIKTIINLRGDSTDSASTALERVFCEKHAVKMVFIAISSRRAPVFEEINKIKKMFDESEKPFLVHCKSGADRAGLVVTLYNLIYYPKMSVDDANQLRWYYGHFTLAETGVLDVFVDEWKSYRAAHPDTPFLDWVENVYDPEETARSFQANRWFSWFVNRVLKRE